MTAIYLAGTFDKKQTETFMRCADEPHIQPLNVLVAYPYLANFLAVRDKLNINKWQLDSGAFSAFNSGKVIDLKQYTQDCKALDFEECFALDVIGDHKAGMRNYEYMLSEGVRPIPVYHPGEPWYVLDHMNQYADKLAIGSPRNLRSDAATKRGGGFDYVSQVFARVWPRKIHGLALSRLSMLNRFPFHSVDSTTWAFQPSAYGHWTMFHRQVRIPGHGVALFTQQVHAFQRRERKYAALWKRELKLAETVKPKMVFIKRTARRRKKAV